MENDKPARATYLHRGSTDGHSWEATLANYSGGTYVVERVEIRKDGQTVKVKTPREGTHATLNAAQAEVERLVREFIASANK